ncbi:hypothetical protein BHM03_00021294, partial [Ensete ventricosum]
MYTSSDASKFVRSFTPTPYHSPWPRLTLCFPPSAMAICSMPTVLASIAGCGAVTKRWVPCRLGSHSYLISLLSLLVTIPSYPSIMPVVLAGFETMNSGDLTETVNSGTNPGDLIETVNSGTNPGDLVERVNSGTNPGDLAERVNSGINPGDLAERVNSGTNLGDLVERANSDTNPEDLAKRVGMTSSDSSSSVRVVSSSGSGEASRCDPEVSSSGASSRPPSSIDARVQRDLEVMKADHNLDTAVTEGSLAVIRERYSIPVEYRLHVPQPGQRPYSSDTPDMCISVDALEASLRFPLHPLIEECLRWWRISPSQVVSNSWRYLVVFLGECQGAEIIPTWDLFMVFSGFRLYWSAHPIDNASSYLSEEESVLVGRLKGIISSSCAIKEMTELWLVEAGLNPTSRDQMDLGELRGMPKVSGGKAPPTRLVAREVDASPTREAPKALSKRPVDAPTEQADDSARRHKKVKVLTRRHKSRHDEGESCSRSKGKEPAAPSEEPDTPVESEGGQMKRAEELDESLEQLVGSGGVREGTSPPQLARELYTLPSEVLLARAAKEMILRDEALLRREVSKKELNEVRSNLAEVQRLLKEARVRARKMDDELLQAVKALESVRVELPRQAVIQYKESLGFKEGLKRMGRGHLQVRVSGGRSISDQKNLDGLSPIKNAKMARDEWRYGIPWTCDVNRPTNWESGSLLLSTNPRREAVVGFGHALAKKFSSNSFANRSNEDIDAGLRQEYQVLPGPLRVVGKARHISASEVSYTAIWARNAACQTIGCQSRVRSEPDRRSDFTTDLAPESGKLRELPRLGAVVAPPQAGPSGSGLLVTPFMGAPSGEPI